MNFHWFSLFFMDFHWFSLIFDYFWSFTMMLMLPIRPPPTRMTHHPSSNIAPRNETGKRSDKYWIYLWNVPMAYYMVLSWISGIFRIFMYLPFFILFLLWFLYIKKKQNYIDTWYPYFNLTKRPHNGLQDVQIFIRAYICPESLRIDGATNCIVSVEIWRLPHRYIKISIAVALRMKY